MQIIKNFLLNIFWRIFHGRPYRPASYDHPGNVETNKFLRNRKKLFIKLAFIVGVPILAISIAFFLIRIYRVDGISMDPGFKNGQLILVQKWDKTRENLRGKQYIPSRFDVVIIKPPDGGPQVIKRVVGLPEEKIFISDGAVFIVNEEHPEGYLIDRDSPTGVLDYEERTSGEVNVTLEKDQVFVLGDNRNHSEDSRIFGPVQLDEIVGKYWDF